MNKKSRCLKGSLLKHPSYKIYLNVNHLNKGDYILKIVYRNKIIKKTKFTKD
jgi:hypothetical protein